MSKEEMDTKTVITNDESQDDRNNLKERVERKRKKINYDQILRELQSCYPATFFINEDEAVPLKVGIYQDILENAELISRLSVSKASLRRFMFCYVSRIAYLSKLKKESLRYDLAGKPVGEVSKEQAACALKEIHILQAE